MEGIGFVHTAAIVNANLQYQPTQMLCWQIKQPSPVLAVCNSVKTGKKSEETLFHIRGRSNLAAKSLIQIQSRSEKILDAFETASRNEMMCNACSNTMFPASVAEEA
jgi:hypothetical protein